MFRFCMVSITIQIKDRIMSYRSTEMKCYPLVFQKRPITRMRCAGTLSFLFLLQFSRMREAYASSSCQAIFRVLAGRQCHPCLRWRIGAHGGWEDICYRRSCAMMQILVIAPRQADSFRVGFRLYWFCWGLMSSVDCILSSVQKVWIGSTGI